METKKTNNFSDNVFYILVLVILVASIYFVYSKTMVENSVPEVVQFNPTGILVFSLNDWTTASEMDPQTALSHGAFEQQFDKAVQAIELAKRQGYIVLYSEMVRAFPDGARLTPEYYNIMLSRG